jgi:hypothetical protein
VLPKTYSWLILPGSAVRSLFSIRKVVFMGLLSVLLGLVGCDPQRIA